MHKSENKIRKTIFKNAGQALIESIQDMEKTDPQKIEDSLSELKVKYVLKKQSKRRFIYLSSVVAVSFLILSLSISYCSSSYLSKQDVLLISMLNDSIPEENREITLITQNDRMELSDGVSLEYKEKSLQVNKEKTVKETLDPIKQNINHIIVPKGKRATITFSDGTFMYVNSGSHVIYPTEFEKEKREILVEGEVFLEVAKDSRRPFFVKTKDLCVQVLGTTFNVSAYKDDEIASVVLVEGSVAVNNNKKKTIISPNEKYSITKGVSTVNVVDVNEYISWKDYIMLFSEHKAGEVFKRLSRYYGIHIDYEQQIALLPVSGKLDLKSGISNSLNILTELLDIKYEINPDGSIRVFQ